MRRRRASDASGRPGRVATAATLSVLFAAEAAGIAWLVWTFLMNGSWTSDAIGVRAIAAACVAAAGVFLAAGLATVGIRAIRARREEVEAQARIAWSDRWIEVVFSDAEPPAGPLTHPALESLLDLREELTGEPAEMVGSLVRDYGVDTRLIDRLQRTAPGKGRRSAEPLERRLELLDELGRARSPHAVPALMAAAGEREPIARLMGIRALVRSVAAIESEAERRAIAPEVANVLQGAHLSMGALAEAMELLGPAAPQVIAVILNDPNHWGNKLVIAGLDTIGRASLDGFSEHIVRFASSRKGGVRLAALHALTKLERIPASADAIIQKAFRDRNPQVRIEAARAAPLLETKAAIYQLEELLCDHEWTVRRVAATTLAGMGGPGIRTLIATSLVHGDQRARNVATQVLVESRSKGEMSEESEKVG